MEGKSCDVVLWNSENAKLIRLASKLLMPCVVCHLSWVAPVRLAFVAVACLWITSIPLFADDVLLLFDLRAFVGRLAKRANYASYLHPLEALMISATFFQALFFLDDVRIKMVK